MWCCLLLGEPYITDHGVKETLTFRGQLMKLPLTKELHERHSSLLRKKKISCNRCPIICVMTPHSASLPLTKTLPQVYFSPLLSESIPNIAREDKPSPLCTRAYSLPFDSFVIHTRHHRTVNHRYGHSAWTYHVILRIWGGACNQAESIQKPASFKDVFNPSLILFFFFWWSYERLSDSLNLACLLKPQVSELIGAGIKRVLFFLVWNENS